jgi:energy-coupling factor transport system permease protein
MPSRYSRLGYINRKSFIHRLNPLTKLLALLCLATLSVVLVYNIAALSIFLFLLLAYYGAGINLRVIVYRLRRLFSFIVLIAFFQLLFMPYGRLLFFLIPPLLPGIGPYFPITVVGLSNALLLSLRLINIVLTSTLFVATTDPTLLANALTRIGLSYRYAFLLVLTLRLVPLFDQEASTVLNAQKTRGIAIDKGIIRGIYTRIRYTFLPLIFSALGRVDALTLAMDGRGFGYAKTRTFLRQSKFSSIDWVLSILFPMISLFLIWYIIFISPLPNIIR